MQPLLLGDYAVGRNSGDDSLIYVLVIRLKPFGVYMTCVVPNKGLHDFAIKRLSQFILSCGLIKFSYRADKEPSVVAYFKKHVG